jgi:hypothetical protein
MASVSLVAEPPRSVLDGHSFLVLAVHPTLADLVVNHDGVDVTVSEHALERVEWHAAFGHIRSKRVAKRVGMHARRCCGLACLVANRYPGAVAEWLPESPAPQVDEDEVVRQRVGPLEAHVIA